LTKNYSKLNILVLFFLISNDKNCSKLNILVLFSKISNDKNDSKLNILHISLKSQNYKITSMKTRLVEGFSVSRVLYKNTIFCGKFLPLGYQKRKSNASSIKDFFWKKEKKRRKKAKCHHIFQGKKI